MWKITPNQRSEEPSAVRPIPPPKVEAHTDPGASDNGKSIFDALKEEVDAATVAEHAAASTCVDAADWLDAPDEPDTPLVHELIELGEMVAIVGQSKAGKSFIALELAVCIALGIPFLGRETVRRKVYIANLEVSRKQYKKRLRRLVQALGVDSHELNGWLFIDNMKGESASWQWCRDEARRHGCAVVLIDPFYQIFKGDENDITACTDAVDEMKVYQKEGFTLIVVFHSPKGFSGDRQLIDMISGSSVLARFPESIFGLLNHATEENARVVKCVLRNYAPPEDQTIRFDEGMFKVEESIAPVVQTANSIHSQRAAKRADEIAAVVVEVLKANGAQKSKGSLALLTQDECARIWGDKQRPGDKKVAAVINSMVERRVLIEAEARSHVRGGSIPIGLPEQMGVAASDDADDSPLAGQGGVYAD